MTKKQPLKKTPMMEQYLSIKKRYPHEILFFRMGDFYEMFLEDAIYAAGVLDIALTKRGDGIPMCGVPYHAWQNYVLKILKDGKNVAICEQIEDPKDVKDRILQRDVIRVLTLGTIFEEELIDKTSRSLLASIFHSDQESFSLAMADLSTGELWLNFIKNDELENYLKTYNVTELLIPQNLEALVQLNLKIEIKNYHFTKNQYQEKIKNSFGVEQISLLEFSQPEIINLTRLFSYIEEIAPRLIIKWQKPIKYYLKKNMYLDNIALETLEILNDQEGTGQASLISILNKTKTKAGNRLLREMLMTPSLNKEEINEKYDLVEFFVREENLRKEAQENLRQIKDAARILNHLRYSPKVTHLGDLKQTLNALQELKNLFKNYQQELPPRIASFWGNSKFPIEALKQLNEILVENDLPVLLDERRFVKKGFSKELDELFQLSESAHELVSNFEKKEQKQWGISTLKIRYNKIIGYHVEISKGMAHLAPKHYLRRQTLTNAERFSLEELNKLESRILNAKEHIIQKQKEIFNVLLQFLLKEARLILIWVHQTSFIDCMISFTEVAVQNKYTRPIIRDDGEMILKDSRHPVVEKIFKEEVFVPNDVHLNHKDRHLAILTGPNMSGKSTYIRQIGLIQIMAQIGSFVPASHAELPLVDRIFTRIGAYDRLFKGESTFFVEMAECAKIFQHYTHHSLILLDEVGRGTSTFDGVSIAQAMLEFLNRNDGPRVKTLFATHFTELSELIDPNRGIFGLTVQIIEENQHISFLRKIREGVTSKSYGIHVAQLAGVPLQVVSRAQEIMKKFEESTMDSIQKVNKKKGSLKKQLAMF